MYARRTALSMTSAIVKVVTGLLIQARDCVEDEKGFEVLNSAPIITKLMPHILASISSLAASDPPSGVQVLSFIQEILPSVASLQNLFLMNQDNATSTDSTTVEAAATEVSMELDTQFYAWVESDHPYKTASVSSYRVLFPSSVQWMSKFLIKLFRVICLELYVMQPLKITKCQNTKHQKYDRYYLKLSKNFCNILTIYKENLKKL